MRLLEGSFTLYTSLSVRVNRIRAKLVCLSVKNGIPEDRRIG